MKNKILTAVAGAFIATSAAATTGTVDSSATTPNLPNLCEFTNVVDGVMTWNETTDVFDLTSAPSVSMKVRDVVSVVVNTDKVLYDDTNSNAANILDTVDYTSATAAPSDSLRSLTASGSATNFTVSSFDAPQYFDMSINHTAVPSQYFVAADFTTYYVRHTITCNF